MRTAQRAHSLRERQEKEKQLAKRSVGQSQSLGRTLDHATRP